MKKLLLLVCLTTIMIGCASNTDVQKETIRNAVLKNAPGMPGDYGFRILEMSEQSVITVGDSVAMLNEKFESDKARDIDYHNTLLKTLESLERAAAGSRFTPQAEKDDAAAKCVRQRMVVDSIAHTTSAVLTEPYRWRDGKDVLTRVIRCRYIVTDPKSGREAEETFDFWMSEDGTRVYTRKKAK